MKFSFFSWILDRIAEQDQSQTYLLLVLIYIWYFSSEVRKLQYLSGRVSASCARDCGFDPWWRQFFFNIVIFWINIFILRRISSSVYREIKHNAMPVFLDLSLKSIWIHINWTVFVIPLLNHPQEPQGCQKIHKNILKIKMYRNSDFFLHQWVAKKKSNSLKFNLAHFELKLRKPDVSWIIKWTICISIEFSKQFINLVSLWLGRSSCFGQYWNCIAKATFEGWVFIFSQSMVRGNLKASELA